MKKKRGILLKISLVIGIVLVAGVVFSFAVLEPNIKIFGWETLDVDKLVGSERTISFLDANDNIIENAVYDANKSYTRISDIPEHTLDAFVSVEDKRFYAHSGIDYIRIGGAIIDNIKSMSFKEGASTISQQLIKNTHLSSDKTLIRKIKEIRIAKELERTFTKSEILEMYLNMLYFGDNIYGITSAAKMLFGEEPKNLTLSQSALIAGIINNPTKYNPYTNPENAQKRRNFVLKAMLDNGKIDESQYAAATGEPIDVLDKNDSVGQYLNGVIKDAREILGLTKKELLSKHLSIATYFDKGLDKELSDILRSADICESADAHIIVLTNRDGSVIGDAGLRDSNLAYLKRQPGSTIKPLIAYAPALENGELFCCSQIYDSPTEFGDYSPTNCKGKYNGWVSVEDSLALSLNIPAVKILDTVGVDCGKALCEKCGIDFSDSDNHLALALGGMSDGVTLRQLTDAYRPFAYGGDYIKGNTVRCIKDEYGNVLYSDNRQSARAMSEETAFLVSTMLRSCAEKGTAKKLSRFGNVCAKTGTVGNADSNSDLYCIAYTPEYTVGVWVGGKAMPNSFTSGGLACGIVEKVLELLNDKSEFKKPAGITCRYIDKRTLEHDHTVLLAGEDVGLKDKTGEWFAKDRMPKEYSTPQNGGYFYYDDMLNLDFDNFEIIEGLFD